jgi:acetylornithine aminotransferase
MDHILGCHEIVKTDFVSGQNCYLYDTEGKKYIDFESGIWATALGHNHPRVNRKMETQLKQIVHLGTRYPNFLAEDAAIDVLDIVGIVGGKCIFLSSGRETVEFGVQVIRHITRKPLLLTFQNSFLASYGSAGRKELDEWKKKMLLVSWKPWTKY